MLGINTKLQSIQENNQEHGRMTWLQQNSNNVTGHQKEVMEKMGAGGYTCSCIYPCLILNSTLNENVPWVSRPRNQPTKQMKRTLRSYCQQRSNRDTTRLESLKVIQTDHHRNPECTALRSSSYVIKQWVGFIYSSLVKGPLLEISYISE